jgi:thiol-disulfide isomerase/thioredoxin
MKPAVELTSLEEWTRESCPPQGPPVPVLLQCGSKQCVRCPAFSEAIAALSGEYEFRWVYVNTHEAEEDLLEELQVARLPAYLLVTQEDTMKVQSATPEQVQEAIRSACRPALKLDDDF